MASNNARGSYYKQRTKKWLEAQGYAVAYLERMHMLRPGKYVKLDQLGADLLAVKDDVLFVQVKFGGEGWRKRGLSEAKKKFEAFPLPPHTAQWIAVWELEAHEPLVYARIRMDYGPPSGWSDPGRPMRLRLGRLPNVD